MPVPLIPLLAMAGFSSMAGSNLYRQYNQRQLYRYQMEGYRRWNNDWQRNVGSQGVKMRYPEMSAPGHMRSLQSGLASSYASSIGTLGGYIGSSAYGASRSLYSSTGKAYRRM